ncbi:MAG: Sec-independent protein translocase subunit TatB [Geodermatophilaceae bacterium]|nr:Sec-independent protein translocase subunit TatB [Geodermatophilaceae bacterium]
MFSSLGWGEIMVLLVVALFIFGPDRLPSIARDASGALKKVRGFVTGAKAQIREELGDDFADLDLGSLNPREFVRRQLLDDDPPTLLKRSNGSSSRAGGSRVGTKPTSARMAEKPLSTASGDTSAPSLTKSTDVPRVAGDAPPYDSDAT